jgi:hypothetical protein
MWNKAWCAITGAVILYDVQQQAWFWVVILSLILLLTIFVEKD